MRTKKKLIIISYSQLDIDPRVLRQIEFLGKDFIIETIGLRASNHKLVTKHLDITYSGSVDFHLSYPSWIQLLIVALYVKPLNFLRWFRSYFWLVVFKDYKQTYWSFHRQRTFQKISSSSPDIIIANDIPALPLAIRLKLAIGAKVYFDAHEYAPLEYENDPKWLQHWAPYFTFLCKKYIPQADYCTTVANVIAEKYYSLTGKQFEVVYNAPEYYNLTPSVNSKGIVRCVHHGVASPVRKIEVIINAFIELGDGFELNLLLLVANEVEYYDQLLRLASGQSNIIFHQPVSTKSIPSFVNQFDISLIFIPPINFNYTNCLPNKFFESIQARLMLLSGPSIEMEHFINKFELGKISSGFSSEDIVSSLKYITRAEIEMYKHNVDAMAKELSAELMMNNLLKKLYSLVNPKLLS